MLRPRLLAQNNAINVAPFLADSALYSTDLSPDIDEVLSLTEDIVEVQNPNARIDEGARSSHDLRSPQAETRHRCLSVLESNSVEKTINGQHYVHTIPSQDFYVHQWNWDSATVALGFLPSSPNRAMQELLSLSSGQWPDGMMPHIHFNPDESRYYPGEDQWNTSCHTPDGIRTSGITQPPIIGITAPVVATAFLQHAIDHHRDLTSVEVNQLRRVIEASLRFLYYIKNVRGDDAGLISVIHPWESGLDNAPTWDEPFEAPEFALDQISKAVKENVIHNRTDVSSTSENVSQRPEQVAYFDYMSLVEQGNQLEWDYDKVMAQSYFKVKDVLFSSVFAEGCERMAQFLESDIFKQAHVGVSMPGAQDRNVFLQTLRAWAKQTRDGLQQTWDPDLKGFMCQDARKRDPQTERAQPIKIDSISKFMPLLAKAATPDQVQLLLSDLRDPDSYGTLYPTPSTPLNARDKQGMPLFEMERYWRGPTWPITNFLLIEGLRHYVDEVPGCVEMIETLKSSITGLVESTGLQEYYHPTGGEETRTAIGFGNFSWTAALYLHLTQPGVSSG